MFSCRRSMVNMMRKMSSAATARRLEGKVAVVTASTDGIGLAIARRLGQDGASVVVSSRKQENVDRTVEQLKTENIKVAGLVCHVAKADHRTRLLQEAYDKFGAIDILVSNAGTNPVFGPILECPESAWDKIFDTNVKASFYLIKEAVPYMEKRGGGAVTVVSSIVGYVPSEFLGVYSVSKTALLGMVKAMAPQLARSNIRINGLAPGFIDTKFSSALTSNETIKEKILESIPMRRLGIPADMAGVVSFLSSDDATYMTGETILATGGINARL